MTRNFIGAEIPETIMIERLCITKFVLEIASTTKKSVSASASRRKKFMLVGASLETYKLNTFEHGKKG